MERKYYINLNCKDNGLYDTENNSWIMKGTDPAKYIDLSDNTIKIKKDGYYLENNLSINITTKRFTISFKYRIDKLFYQKNYLARTDIYSLCWNSGYIKVLEFDEDQQLIAVCINNYILRIPANYLKYTGWNHLLITCNNGIIQIYYNGIRKLEDIYSNITYNFDSIKLGNYIIQHNSTNDPVIEYDDIVLVNDCLYNEEFNVPSYPLKVIFPERYIKEKEENTTMETLVAAPVLFSTKDSLNDIIHDKEIVRHKAYKEDKSLYISKYNFN